MPRSHNKKHFFKFMSFETAVAVLKSSSLRWTKPSEFNDPFDHQVSFKYNFSKEELAKSLYQEIERLVYSDTEAVFFEATVLNELVTFLRSIKYSTPKTEVIRQLKLGCLESSEGFEHYKKKMDELLKDTLNRSRVLCVTEANENVVMWSHYGDSHRGISLRLECVDEVDTSLLVAKPVIYTDTFPCFIELHEYVDYLTGQKPSDMGSLFLNTAYFKNSDWAYEGEWRLHRPHEDEHGLFSDWLEDTSVFGAIYLGCRIDPGHATKLMEIIEVKYPDMEVYQTSVSKIDFKLDFERIK